MEKPFNDKTNSRLTAINVSVIRCIRTARLIDINKFSYNFTTSLTN